jgi:hypothetical protein
MPISLVKYLTNFSVVVTIGSNYVRQLFVSKVRSCYFYVGTAYSILVTFIWQCRPVAACLTFYMQFCPSVFRQFLQKGASADTDLQTGRPKVASKWRIFSAVTSDSYKGRT